MKEDYDESRLEHQPGAGRVARIVTAAGAAALSTAIPGAAPLIAAGSIALEEYGKSLNSAATARRTAFLLAGADQARVDIQEFFQRLRADDDLLLLSAEAMEAAQRARLMAKSTALGQCLGNIILDDALYDEEAIWLNIIAKIERPHIRILTHFLENQGVTDEGLTDWGLVLGMDLTHLSEISTLGDAVLPLVEQLQQLGLLLNSASAGLGQGTPASNQRHVCAGVLAIGLLHRLEKAGFKPSDTK